MKEVCCTERKIISKNYIQNVLLTFRTIVYCFRLEHNYKHGSFCSKFLYILAKTWISKTMFNYLYKNISGLCIVQMSCCSGSKLWFRITALNYFVTPTEKMIWTNTYHTSHHLPVTTASKEVYTQRLHNKSGHVDKQLFLKNWRGYLSTNLYT